MDFLRRISLDPRLTNCAAKNCPDIWELDTGDYAVIGGIPSDVLLSKLPASASCGPNERLVVIPRGLLVGAKPNLPDSV